MSGIIAQPVEHVPPARDFTFLPPTALPFAYANVDRFYATRAIPRGNHVFALPRGEEIAPRYSAGGVEHDVGAYIDRTNAAGLIVIKRGRIVLERYALGHRPEVRWNTASCVKSMTSTLAGAALRDGAIGSLDDPVTHYVPAVRGSAYDGATVRHLLTMSSGAGWTEVYTERESDASRYSALLAGRIPGSVINMLRTIPRGVAPGTRFSYSTGDSFLLGCVVTASTGTTLAAYMSEKIWANFGMEFDAYYTLESDDGQDVGSGRAGVALRDFARFGLFILGGGMAQGLAVLPEGWVDDAGRTIFPLGAGQSSYGAAGYGYTWWIDPDGSMVAVGFGGQSIYINRRADLVIATQSCWPQPPFDAAYGVDRAAERLAFRAAVVRCLAD
jgi:CubicO group peptidase (beta-lactamase class C family)